MSRALELYAELREDLGAAGLASLRVSVRSHFEDLVRVQQRDELIAVDLGELLCVRLEGLLIAAHQFDGETRASVVGAARYFISSDDAVPDERSCTGLDDDVDVFNHVARQIGRADLVITE
jgi:hypothetical protein